MGSQAFGAGARTTFVGCVVSLLLVALALGSAPASAAGLPFLWQAGEAGAGAGQTSLPRGVAVAPEGAPNEGRVFVADQGNRRILELTPWGEFVKTWGWDVVASGPGNTGTGFEICVPADGDVCQTGSSGSGAGQTNGTHGVAVDGSGSIYVGDRNNRRVQKFDPEGNFVLMFGGEVNKTKVDEGTASEAEENLCPFDPGDVCKAGVQGTGNGRFGAWSIGDFVEVDPSGNVWVGDQKRVQRFNAAGEYQGEFSIGEETAQSLAADPDGNLYLARWTGSGTATKDGVLKYSPAGALLKECAVSEPQGIALDPESRMYVVSGVLNPTIRKYAPGFAKSSAACEEEEEFGREEPPAPAPSASTGIAFGLCEGSPPPGNLLFTNLSSTQAFVRSYGSGPVGCEEAPPHPPQILAQYALSVDADSALLQAEIKPRFFPDTTYELEYGTGTCSAGGCPAQAPAEALLLTEEITDEAVVTEAISLTGLAPGTTYHYRFLAQSKGGGPEHGTRPEGEAGEDDEASFAAGIEGTFTTPPLPGPPPSGCANDALRTGPAAFLPECRAFEMVSPVDKNGFGVETGWIGANPLAHAELDQSSDTGAGFAYSSKQAFGDQQSAPWSPQYLAGRHPEEGWSSHGISPPYEGYPGSERLEMDTEFKYFSEDLSEAWLFHNAEPPLDSCAPQNSPVLYRRDNPTDTYRVAHCEPNKPETPSFTIDLQGISSDGCRAVFRSNSKLTEDAEPTGPTQLYEYDCEGGEPDKSGAGGLRLVSVLPDAEGNCKEDSTAGSSPTTAPTPDFTSNGREMNVWHAFSADAERLYWTCDKALYLRTDPTPGPGDEGSVLVSPTEFGVPVPTSFKAASPDGAWALMVIEGALWSYEAGTATREEIASGIPPVGGFLGASEDATRTYFVSSEALTAEPSSRGEVAEKGENNLYLHQAGEGFTFIGVLSADDLSSQSRRLSPTHLRPFRRASRVSPDGLHLAFISQARLTGYDNTDQRSGEADNEVFLYDAAPGAAGELRCISCNPTGARPVGRNVNDEAAEGAFWAAAWIPGWSTQLYQGRPLSADGDRLFFNSVDALLPRDTNGRIDVYEWTRASSLARCQAIGAGRYLASAGGCLSLISTGRDGSDSEFIDADKDGSDAFIRTAESLVGSDPGLLDIYDARVGGGFPEPPAPKAPCEGGACQSPSAPSAFPPLSSSAFQSPGDPEARKPRRCPEGKRKVRRKGRVRCVEKKRGRPERRRGGGQRRRGGAPR